MLRGKYQVDAKAEEPGGKRPKQQLQRIAQLALRTAQLFHRKEKERHLGKLGKRRARKEPIVPRNDRRHKKAV